MPVRASLIVVVLVTCVMWMAAGAIGAAGERVQQAGDPEARSRLLVLTDISNEPDDEQSLVRLLVYSNEFEIEGLVATTSTHLRKGIRPDLIRRQIEAYGQVRPNLVKHARGFPEASQLMAVLRSGQPEYGMAAVGDDKATEGSRLVIDVVDRADPRPVWISVWGGANTLAQALWDVRRTRSPEAVEAFVSKMRVYSISDQDDAGRWMRLTFPSLFYIVTPSDAGWKEYYRATWTGISGDRHYKNGPMHRFELVDNPWLEANVRQGHGPLGALYPRTEYIMEGDTPAYLGLVNNGLGWDVSPGYGGWGGRYVLYQTYAETRPIWTNNHDARDTVVADDGRSHTSAQATIWRWREHYQQDFAARMDWCVAERFEQANHNPVAVLNGDTSKRVLELTARAGDTVTLSATGSSDPDGQRIAMSWFVYREAGTYEGDVKLSSAAGDRTTFVAPAVKRPSTVHVILQVQDDGTPQLTSYRRAVVTVTP
jgi:hypothetical protein